MSTIIDATPTVGERKVDVTKGSHRMDVAAQWATRPADQKFLSLDALAGHVHARRERSESKVVALSDFRFSAEPGRDELFVDVDGREGSFTNWSFGQLCREVRFPAAPLRRLPPALVAANLQALALMEGERPVQRYTERNGDVTLRALTGPSYGRIFDAEVVAQVQRIAAEGTWKVPGTLDWSTGRYDPNTPVTPETTTLFASDRDVFLFLCDDLHPIEVGKTKSGDPDLMFRGFLVSNSETGAGTFRLATMYLRAVCCNRILWGVENFQEVSIRHNSKAPDRFADEVMPGLLSYTRLDPMPLVRGVEAARQPLAILATGEADERAERQVKFLTDLGFSEKAAKAVIETVVNEEDREPDSPWLMAQGITAYARTIEHQDKRFEVEQTAGKLLDQAVGKA